MGDMTREELAAMTDQKLLADEREHHGDPYMSLLEATGMQRVALQFWPVGAAWNKADRAAEAEGAASPASEVFPIRFAVVLESDDRKVRAPHGPEIHQPVIDFDDQLGVSSPEDPDDIIDHLFAYYDAYSDGTPVSIVVGPPSSRGWSAQGDAYDCGIPWYPKVGDGGYVTHGPIPPGCKVMVMDPPHWRMSKEQAGCQQAYSESEGLTARLREAKKVRTS
jgi:hypothetical protein